ncbi:CDP-alcohol phosphatidyltransferase family protein [Vibrio europaeus]|uniref:CDP-alcohol phosphatidyltransferase family protein n=1 Tax=Vibrio europaeus TaxID=300876 RepID=UPI00148C59FC|nr:CDP-alcohol phosphatidyltransferase family protein [Vibrio europaeus]MDC5822037.1 CDP-alcohol phosphatidyltransferase family protein [Vibrio europaeus]MDC5837982.1 CDP-alcohol phosphatidyltransferase family protein [Vibrio europaeus]MDC5855122.1 CDP-alcohol phosphatidyltransferase family protein [Vibrio europaeus]NOH22766.1 hypothetical protein [Vibrio europaeus]
MNFFDIVSDIYSRQAFKEFYSRYFSGKLSPVMAAYCYKKNIHPNVLTLAMIPVGIVGGGLFINGGELSWILGGLAFIFLNILDAADGEVARYSNKTSLTGDYYDRVAHYVTDISAYLGGGLGLYLWLGDSLLLYVTFLLVLVHVSDIALRDLRVLVGVDSSQKNQDEKATVKDKKKNTKMPITGAKRLIGEVLFTNVAFFHLVPVIAVIQLLFSMNFPYLLVGYFCIFTVVNTLKLIIRSVIIYKLDDWR